MCLSSVPAFMAQKYCTSFITNTPRHINDGYWASMVGNWWGVKCKRGDHDNVLSPTDVGLSPTDTTVAVRRDPKVLRRVSWILNKEGLQFANLFYIFE